MTALLHRKLPAKYRQVQTTCRASPVNALASDAIAQALGPTAPPRPLTRRTLRLPVLEQRRVDLVLKANGR